MERFFDKAIDKTASDLINAGNQLKEILIKKNKKPEEFSMSKIINLDIVQNGLRGKLNLQTKKGDIKFRGRHVGLYSGNTIHNAILYFNNCNEFKNANQYSINCTDLRKIYVLFYDDNDKCVGIAYGNSLLYIGENLYGVGMADCTCE